MLIIWVVLLFFIDISFRKRKIVSSKEVRILSLFVLLNAAYGFVSILPYVLKSGGDIIPLVSAIKFYKSMLLFFVGIYFANKISFREKFFDYSVLVISLIIIIMLFSTLLDERFPVMLWGEKFFDLIVYGFPNTGMAFIALITLFVLAKYYISKQRKYGFIYMIGVLLVVFSLSRSSFLVLFFGTIFLSSKMIGIRRMIGMLFVLIFLFSGTIMMLGSNEKVEKIVELVQYRIDRTMGKTGDDPTSGRTEIWAAALTVINEKPIFGYGFEPFSNRKIADYDTPHQQYLEIIYKTGVFGFLLYIGVIVYASLYIHFKFKKSRYSNYGILKNVYLAGLIAIMVSNFTQPNFSFALTGNLLFFMMGFLVTIPN